MNWFGYFNKEEKVKLKCLYCGRKIKLTKDWYYALKNSDLGIRCSKCGNKSQKMEEIFKCVK